MSGMCPSMTDSAEFKRGSRKLGITARSWSWKKKLYIRRDYKSGACKSEKPFLAIAKVIYPSSSGDSNHWWRFLQPERKSSFFLFKRPLAVSNLDVANYSLIFQKQKSYIYVTCGLGSPLAKSSNGTSELAPFPLFPCDRMIRGLFLMSSILYIGS